MKKFFYNLKEKLNKFLESKYFPYFMIFIFSVLLMLPEILGKVYSGGDNHFHIYSFMSYAKNLPMSIFSKILPGISFNLGYGEGIFYPALPHIIGAFIYKLGSIISIGEIGTWVIINFLIYFFSGTTMYILGKKIFNEDKLKSLISALFYITYNYFFVDVIFRGALNEAFLFIFMPLVFLGLWYLFIENNHKKFYIFFISGYLGLMYSHLVMSAYFTLFLLVFLLFFVKDVFKKKNFCALLLASLFILIFTSTFTVPMIEHKLFGDYVVFQERIWSYHDVWNMPFQGFFTEYLFSDECGGYIYSNLNFVVIIFFVLAIWRLFTNKVSKNLKKFLLGIAVFGLLGIILNSFVKIWLHVPSILLSIQFVWRLSSFVGFAFCIVAALGLDSYLNLFKDKFKYIALAIILIILGISVFNNYKKVNFNQKLEIGDVNNYGGVREHFPTVTYNSAIEYIKERNSEEIIVDGSAKVKVIENDVPYMKFEVSDCKEEVNIQLPRLYYLGYTISKKGAKPIPYEQDKYGLITLDIKENGIYEVKYTGTFAYKVASIVKYGTIIVLIGYGIYKHRKNKKLVTK